MKTLDAQSKQDRESVERLWLRIPRLNAAKIQAHANDDLGLCNEIDEELKTIQIQVEELALGINSMERDITEISNLLTEQWCWGGWGVLVEDITVKQKAWVFLY